MKILITGGCGFLGKRIKAEFINDNVFTLGRGEGSSIICDLSKSIPALPSTDIVIHLAGKVHQIASSKLQESDFYNMNVVGTQNLLIGLERAGKLPQAFVFSSSVAVYGKEKGLDLSEDEPLLAKDAYGRSKVECEKLIFAWCSARNITCTILRLPLVAGPNPPGNLSSMINGISKGFYFNISKGEIKRSMVLAEDVAKVIPVAITVGGIYNLTDGYNPTFKELSELIALQLCKSSPLQIPYWLAKYVAKLGDIIGNNFPINSVKLRKMTSNLTFSDSKARESVNWNPTPVLNGFRIY